MSTPLCMPVAAPVPYTSFLNPTIPVIISLSLYLAALLVTACILRYFHLRANPPPYACHISQPLRLTNLPTRPRPTFNQSGSPSSQCLGSLLYTPSSLPPLPFSSLLKDSPATKPTSLVNSSSNSFTTLPSPRSSTSEPARTTYLTSLDSCFTPPSLSYPVLSLNYSTPIPSTNSWRSSLAKSYIRPSAKSISPSSKQNNNITTDKWESITPSLPFPWPFEFPHVPPHLLPPR